MADVDGSLIDEPGGIGISAAGNNRQEILLEDYRDVAKATLPKPIFDYIEGWAGDGQTYRHNCTDFDRLLLTPLAMRDVSIVDVAATYLGRTSSLPIGFSPSAFHRLAHPLGEAEAVRAAKAKDIPMIVSCMSSISLEEVARQANGARLWLHAYFFKDRAVLRDLVARAEGAGFEAISLGLGCPAMGKRPANLRNRFTLPAGIEAANFTHSNTIGFNNPIHSLANAKIDPSATWKDVEWLCGITKLPVIGKGIMNASDAAPALDSGLSALMVSNHGGRQLDGSISTIKALADIVAEVSDRGPVFLDGGVRRGTDIVKALALGADAVFLGRPVLWALATDGGQGVISMVKLLQDELHLAMQLLGCSSIAELRRQAASLVRWG
jgi:isopentenyl diphosphate isomerase/L-lactate dehydrogenase-like FMN-dependent dehydrogenase